MPPKNQYDVAISFAGSDRGRAKQLADALHHKGATVFYDEYEKSRIWGKDLYRYLADIYKNQATYCVVLFSDAYGRNIWTQHELRAAEARSLEQDQEYILPVRLDNAAIPDTVKTIGYISWPPETAETLASFLLAKLGKASMTAVPLSASADSIQLQQLPKSIRIVALGAPGAGKTFFFLYLVNALLRGGRYRPAASPGTASAEMSNILMDVRKAKWPATARLGSQSEMTIALEDSKSKKLCLLKVYLASGEHLVSFDSGKTLRSRFEEKLIQCDVILSFVPSNESPKWSQELRQITSFLQVRRVDKPFGIIFTKWDLIRGELVNPTDRSIQDRSLFLNWLNEHHKAVAQIESFRDHEFFYFSAAPLLREMLPSTSSDGLAEILPWILSKSSVGAHAKRSGFPRWLDVFIQTWRSARGKKDV